MSTVSQTTSPVFTPGRQLRAFLARKPTGIGGFLPVLVGGIAALVSSGVHFYLWDIAYRYVPTFRFLFLIQGVSAALVGLALIVLPRGAVLLAALGLLLGTIVGFVLVLYVTLFGFRLDFISGWAKVTLVSECVGVVVLGLASVRLWRN